MSKFIIGPTKIISDNKLSVNVSSPATITEIWFAAPSIAQEINNEDFLLPASLFCAMRSGLPLHIHGSLSKSLTNKINLLQTIFNKWFPDCKKIHVTWDNTKDDNNTLKGKIGCFFSGGLDSFYTFLKHYDEIDLLVLVHGFDFWLDDYILRGQVSNSLQEIARQFGKPLLEIETNLREFTDQFLDWGKHIVGSGLASVALLLSSKLRKMYIPASQNYAHLEPTGSHILLDPIWSNGEIEIVHDGFEANRVEKAQIVAQSDAALAYLRVCYQNLLEKGNYGTRSEKWNCGRCEKCVRTMLNLYLAGALNRCPRFNTALTPQLIKSIELKDHAALIHMEDNLLALKTREGESDLTRAVNECINNYHYNNISKFVEQHTESFFASAPWQDLSNRKRNTLFKSLYYLWGSWLTRESIKEELKKYVNLSL
jgi:predicted PP-loop superfamily ATPase